MRSITEIKNDIARAERDIATWRTELRAAQEAEYDLRVGDIVIATIGYGSSKREVQAQIAGIRFWSAGPNLDVKPLLKDGSRYSKSAQYCSSWRKLP